MCLGRRWNTLWSEGGITMAIGVMFLVIGIAATMGGIIAELADWDCGRFPLGWLAGSFVILGIVLMVNDKLIKPIDVYQGKTTLKYTVVDTVKVDSIVVWKIKEE